MAARAILLVSLSLIACSADGGDDTQGERGNAGVDATADTTLDVAVDSILADTSSAAEADVDAVVDTGTAVVDASPHVCPASGAAKDCTPGTGTGEGDECAKDSPSCYLAVVKKAVGDQVSMHPEWFDFSGPSGCPIIKDVDTFMNAVVDAIAAHDLCVERDKNAPNEEVTVKKDNAFSENFDIVASSGCARYGDLIYTGHCAPAWW